MTPADRPPPQFQAAHAADAPWPDLVDRCLARLDAVRPDVAPGVAASGVTLAPHLGFIYVTDLLAEDLPQILDRLRARTGIADWIGTTGIGIAANGGTPDLPVSGAAMETAEYYNVPAMAVMLADWPRDAYRLLAPMTDGSQAALDRHAAWIKARQPGLGVIHADPHQPGLPARIDLLAAASGAFLVGGLSSSRGAAPQVAGELGEDGLSGLLLDSGITVLAGLSQGCSPIGPLHRVTEADRNIIMSIDGRPALEVMKEEIGEMLSRDLRRCANYIFVGLPVAGSDTGDYLVRQLTGIDSERGWIAVGDLMERDQQILFARRDVQTARDDLDRMLQRLKSRLDRPVRGGLYFSCLSRGVNMFGADAAETRQILDTLGDFPLVGFFANGEISHGRLYGHTGVLALFL